jgi:uncharacterized membrane protein YphA (DoxX/SURF4 family)
MDKVILIARILLGLIFFVFGLNGFFHFMPIPPPATDAAGAFMGGLAGSGYFFPLLKIVETASGALLLAGFFVPLALTLLAPIIVNIFLYHVFLDSGNLVMAIVILVLECFLAWAYCDSYKGVLEARAKPSKP